MKDLFNEPILSLNDLLSVWSENNQKASPLFQNFEKLAKSKLGIKPELEVGKIYKNKESLFRVVKICRDDVYADGLDKGNWRINGVFSLEYGKYDTEATTEEWVEAIKKECEKRGLKDGNYKSLTSGIFIEYTIPEYIIELDRLWTSHGVIYEKGIFATPIPILTKKEAEEKLNCIIE